MVCLIIMILADVSHENATVFLKSHKEYSQKSLLLSLHNSVPILQILAPPEEAIEQGALLFWRLVPCYRCL
jgi:uncharacterized membrane protein